MKTILTAVLFLFLLLNVQAQKKDSTSKTTIEAFESKTGVILKKEFFTIGDFKSEYSTVSIEVLKITDMVTGKGQAGLKLSEQISNSYSTQTESAYLDADEMDDFLNFFIKVKDLGGDVATYTEYNFITKGNVKAYAFKQPGEEWQYGFYINVYNSNSVNFFKADQIGNFISLLQAAKTKLDMYSPVSRTMK